jgi:hypothetical protein
MDLREKVCSGVEWIDQAQDRDQWSALMNIVFGFSEILGNS